MLLEMCIPYLEEVKILRGYPVWVTSDNKWGVLIHLSPLDAEAVSLNTAYQRMGEFFKQLPTGIKIRFISKTRAYYEEKIHSRTEAVNELGSLNTDLFLSIEFSGVSAFFKDFLQKLLLVLKGSLQFSVSEDQVKGLLNKVDLGALAQAGFNPVAPTIEQVEELWPENHLEIGDYGRDIDLGPSRLTTLRLWKPGTYPIQANTLADIKTRFCDEVDFCVSLQKISQARSTIQLSRKEKQSKAGSSYTEAIQNQDAQVQISQAVLEGATKLEVEWVAILQRTEEERLRQDELILSRELRKLGDIADEGCSAAENWAATLPGGGSVQTFLEDDYKIPYYLPLASHGISQKVVGEVSPHALCLGRRDGSLDYFDTRQKGNRDYSAIIGGAPGRGKTVFIQQLIMALLYNPTARIMNVEAGGNALETCKWAGASIHEFKFGKPSNIDPFLWIPEVDDVSFLEQNITSIIAPLILDNNELILGKELKAHLEKEVIQFIRSMKTGHYNGNPVRVDSGTLSMDGFINQLPKDFPRRRLIERWGTGQKFGDIMRRDPNNPEDLFSNRHHYYNFTSLSEAADREFAQASVSLVCAQANLEAWKAKESGKVDFNIIFDETKFVFRQCIETFLFSVATVRKLNQGLFLANQDTSAFLVPRTVSDDRHAVFNNVTTHILFGSESKTETREEAMQDQDSFVARHGLSEKEFQMVRSVDLRPPYYSEIFVKDGRGSRILRNAPTRSEYWRYTSTPKDVTKKEMLQNALPSLSSEEIVQWMVINDLKTRSL